MTLFDFSQSIKNLNQDKKFTEALKFFKENKAAYTSDQIGLNKYIVCEMILALIETNNHDVIFTFINQYNIILDSKNFSYLLKKFKDKPSVNWNVISKFCDLISVDSLGTDCKTIEVEQKGEKRQMELASDKENWYAAKTKALFETKKYQECFQLSKEALDQFEKFHYSNDVWFARRIALSKKSLGNSTDALNELLHVLERKREWFIQSEIAEIYNEHTDVEKAFQYAMEAINNFGDIEYKVELLVLIGNILEKKQEKELSFKHYMLSKLLRQQKGWRVPASLDFLLKKLGYVEISLPELGNLKKELKFFWLSLKPKRLDPTRRNTSQLTGRINKILHNDQKGADGFIRADSNKHIYFRLDPSDKLIKMLNVGLDVTFNVLPSKNDKKEKAINIKIK